MGITGETLDEIAEEELGEEGYREVVDAANKDEDIPSEYKDITVAKVLYESTVDANNFRTNSFV